MAAGITLGPGFMRGSGGSNKVQSGYASSPDGGGPDFSSMRVSSRFSSIPEGSYPGTHSSLFYSFNVLPGEICFKVRKTFSLAKFNFCQQKIFSLL